jgi:hypothetical protein
MRSSHIGVARKRMKTLLTQSAQWPLVAGAALLVGTGLVQTTQRPDADAVAAIARRVGALPADFGDWIGRSLDLDAKTLAIADARGYRNLWLRNAASGRELGMLTLCGLHGPMAVHTPEICLSGGGFEQIGATRVVAIGYGKPREATMAYVDFRRTALGADQHLRVYYSFNDGSGWVAPDNPRVYFAGTSCLVKVYVIDPRVTAASDGLEHVTSLLQACLPRLDAELFESGAAANGTAQ